MDNMMTNKKSIGIIALIILVILFALGAVYSFTSGNLYYKYGAGGTGNFVITLGTDFGSPTVLEDVLIVFSAEPLDSYELDVSFRSFVETGNSEQYIELLEGHSEGKLHTFSAEDIDLESQLEGIAQFTFTNIFKINQVTVYAIPRTRSGIDQYVSNNFVKDDALKNGEDKRVESDTIKKNLLFRSVDGGLTVPFNVFAMVEQVEEIEEDVYSTNSR